MQGIYNSIKIKSSTCDALIKSYGFNILDENLIFVGPKCRM